MKVVGENRFMVCFPKSFGETKPRIVWKDDVVFAWDYKPTATEINRIKLTQEIVR